jgi:cytochrome c biogenesis protein CcmG/thiol:disulfide interchange protein DsbE
MVTPRQHRPPDNSGHQPDEHSPWRIRPAILFTGLALILVFAAGWWLTRDSSSGDEVSPLDQAVDLSDLLTGAPEAREPAPDFSIPARGGGDFTLSTHLATDGRPVFLNLWASWCLPCRTEMPAIDEAARRHGDVAFVGVAVQDDESEAGAFADEIGVSYTIAYDVRDQVNASYPTLGLPATFLIDSDGTIVETYIGTLNDDVIDGLVELVASG